MMAETRQQPARAEMYRAQAAELLERLGTVCVIDVETTAFVPDDGRAVEIALVHFKGDTIARAFSTVVRAGIEVKKLHNMVPVDLIPDAPAFGDIAPVVESFIENCDLLLGQNVPFDMAWIEKEFERTGMKIEFPPAIDLIRVAKAAFPGLAGGYGLDSIVEAAGSPVHRPRHRALSDCMTEHGAFVDSVAELIRHGQAKSTEDFEPFLVRGPRRSPKRDDDSPPPGISETVESIAEKAARREVLSLEIERDETILADYAAREGKKFVRGKDHFAAVGGYPLWEPTGDEESRLMTRALLEDAKLWNDISDLDRYALGRAIEEGRVPEAVVGALGRYGRLKQIRRVRVYPKE